jgi:hypothetical protein
MTKRQAWRRLMACAAVITAFGVGAYQIRELKAESPFAKKTGDEQAAVGKEPAPLPEEGKNPKKEALPLKVKVFRLSHVDPESALSMLEGLLDRPSQAAIPPGPSGVDGQALAGAPSLGAMGGGFGALGALGGGLGAIGGVGGGQGALGAFGGGLGVGGGGPGGFGTAATWRLVTDDRTHSLVIRGTEVDLQIAADLVAVLDLPADKPIPKVKTLHAFKLRFADGDELADVLRRLELKARLVAFPGQEDRRANLIVVRASEDVIKEIGSVIEQLDVEVKGEPENKPINGNGN